MFVTFRKSVESKSGAPNGLGLGADGAMSYKRWGGLIPWKNIRHDLRTMENRGKWLQLEDNPGWWQYLETDQEKIWANEMDRQYLRILFEKDPDKFLAELTPNPKHDGACVGLDLNHPPHVDLQKAFQAEVIQICKAKRLIEHPALLANPQIKNGADGGSKLDLEYGKAKIQEIAALEKTISVWRQKNEQQAQIIQQTLDEKNNLQQKHKHLLIENQQLSDEKVTWQAKERTFSTQITKLTQQNQRLMTARDTLQKQIQTMRKMLTQFIDDEQLQRKLKTTLNPRSSWLRIWEGKYSLVGEVPKYEPVAAKEKGCTIGFIAKTPKGKKYLAKLGVPDEEHMVAPSLSTRKHNYQRSIISVITEKIGADVYAVLGNGFYYVPKHRLARLKILNRFTESDPFTNAVIKKINHKCKEGNQISTGVHLMSHWIEAYRDIDLLEKCSREKNDTMPKAFLDCLAAGYVPEYAHIEGAVVPILGLMEILAASRLLADTDVLGGGGKNAGFVVERNDEGLPLAIRMVKVDAGEAFNFSGENNQLIQSFNTLSSATKLKNPKDLQFGNQQPITIPWSGLLDRQRNAFLQALARGLALLNKENMIDFLTYRQGEFDRAVIGNRIVMIKSMLITFKKDWQKYQKVQTMPQVYGDVITQIEQTTPSDIPFRPKMYGAANHQANEAIHLSMGGAGK